MTISNLSNQLAQKEGQLQKTILLMKKHRKADSVYTKHLLEIQKAEEILKLIADNKQEMNIKYIETIVTSAIHAIFDDDISFKIELVHERNKVGYKFYIIDNTTGHTTDPKINEAGGLRDILSFSLRVALWGLTQGNKSNVMILDEPFHFFNAEDRNKTGELIKELSQKLNIQFIIATHQPDIFIDGFGKVIKIKKDKQI